MRFRIRNDLETHSPAALGLFTDVPRQPLNLSSGWNGRSGGIGDPATPYIGAVALAETLGSATLLTRDGEGHTAYGQSACINHLEAVRKRASDGATGSVFGPDAQPDQCRGGAASAAPAEGDTISGSDHGADGFPTL